MKLEYAIKNDRMAWCGTKPSFVNGSGVKMMDARSAGLSHIIPYVMIGLGVVAGAWFLRDGLRLVSHLRIADRLIGAGMPEEDALREAGCLFWDIPWYKRMLRRYPPLRQN